MKSIFPSLVALLVIAILAGPVLAEEQPLVSTLFYETDIREAINELVLQTGTNIIVDDTVQGVVTLDLVDVPLEKALRMILISGGFTYRKIDDFYLVGLPDPRSPTFQNLVETETIRLRHLNAAEAQDLLPSFYDRYLRSARDGGSITISAAREIIARFKLDLEKIDQPRREVLIKAIVTEVSEEVLQDLGGVFLNWLTEGKPSWDGDGMTALGLPSPGNLAVETTVFGALETTLRALERTDQAKVRANPQIRVVDRGSAHLFVGDTRHIYLRPDEGSTSRLETVDVGVSLEVTPRILGNGEIHLTISPEISHVTDERSDNLIVRRSEMASSLFLQNGETALLAGMTIEDTLDSVRKVPVLGDIPIVRWFFRQTTERQGERELLIFIAAEIIEGKNFQ